MGAGHADIQLHPQPGGGGAGVGDGDDLLHRLAGHDAGDGVTCDLISVLHRGATGDAVVQFDVDGAGGDDVGGAGVLREVGEGAGGQQRQDQDHRAGEHELSLHGGNHLIYVATPCPGEGRGLGDIYSQERNGGN